MTGLQSGESAHGVKRSGEFLSRALPWAGLAAGLAFPLLPPSIRYTKWAAPADLTVIALAVALIVRRIYQSATRQNAAYFPGPEWVWRLLFNRIPARFNAGYSPTHLVMLLIGAEEHKEIFDANAALFGGLPVKPEVFLLRHREAEQQERDLVAALRRVDAVYVLLDEATKEKPWVIGLVTNWAVHNSHLPALACDLLGEPLPDIPFRILPIERARDGAASLLRRATERAKSWRDQASLFRKVALTSLVGAALLSIGSAGLAELVHYQKLRSYRSNPELYNLNSRAIELQATAARFLAGKSIDADLRTAVTNYLGAYASAIEKDFEHVYGADAAGRVSFWRHMHSHFGLNDSVPVLVRVGSSGGSDRVVYREGYASLIGSAFRERVFVSYTSRGDTGKACAWTLAGTPAGTLMRDGKAIHFFGSNNVGSFAPEGGPHRDGMICYAEAANGDTSVLSGVHYSVWRRAPRMDDEYIRLRLSESLSLLHSIPDELLLTDELRGVMADSSKWGPRK